MANNRIARENETREVEERPKAWSPPKMLPEPAPQDGYAFRWVRVSSRGEMDATNVSAKFREGWEPVKAEDHPEIFVANPEIERFKDNIVIGGLILCKAPEEMSKQRNHYYNSQARSQMESVDNNLMRESDPRMPLFNDRKSKVTFGNGN